MPALSPSKSCFLALALTMAASAHANLVTINSITYTGTATVESAVLGDAANLVNGNGLSAALSEANINSVTHANPSFSSPGNVWTTTAPGGSNSDFFASTSATVVFEIVFDQAYNLTNFYNWSYDFDEGTRNGNNIRTVSFDYGVGNFASSTGSVQLTTLPGNNVASNTPLAITADRVRITVLDNYRGVSGFGGGDRVSAAEFAFLGLPASADPVLVAPASITVNNNGFTQTVDVTLTNNGVAQNLLVSNAQVTGTDAAGFTVLTDLTTPLSIPPGGGTGVIQIQVNPVNLPPPGAPFLNTFLEISSNDMIAASPRSIPINGVVRNPWIQAVASVDLGTVLSSAAVQNFNLTVNNLGAGPLTVDDGLFSNGGPAFSVVDDLVSTPLVVAGGGSGQVNLSFNPNGKQGVVSGTLTLYSDDPVSFLTTVNYTVNVVRDPVISAGSSVNLTLNGLAPQSFSIPVGNTGPSSALELASASFTGGDATKFTVTGFDSPIAVSGSGNVNVSFNPGSLYGTYSSTLVVQTNDSVQPTTQIPVTVNVVPLTPAPFSPGSVNDAGANSFANAGYVAANLINGGFVPTLGNAPAGTNNWVSNASGTDYFAAGTPPVLVFDLGADVDVRLIYLWAYSEGTTFGGVRQGNSLRSFSLRFATAADGTSGFGTSIPANPSLTAMPALPTLSGGAPVAQPVQVFDLGTTVTARYVEMTLTDNFRGFTGNDGGDRVGINEIAFDSVAGTGGTPYEDWMDGFPSLTGDDTLPDRDPDGDGIDNLGEFGFDGNPDDGSDNGKVFVVTADGDDSPDATDELILTVAMRAGATFPASGVPLVSTAVDGVTYRVEGSIDLSTFGTQVNRQANAIGAGLPSPNAGWEYRSFSLEGSNGLTGKGFLRAGVTQVGP